MFNSSEEHLSHDAMLTKLLAEADLDSHDCWEVGSAGLIVISILIQVMVPQLKTLISAAKSLYITVSS
jgi:hypothetical protein